MEILRKEALYSLQEAERLKGTDFILCAESKYECATDMTLKRIRETASCSDPSV